MTPRAAGPSQPKTGRGTGRSPVILPRREAPGSNVPSSDLTALLELPDSEFAPLIEYIKILDRWDREAHGNRTM